MKTAFKFFMVLCAVLWFTLAIPQCFGIQNGVVNDENVDQSKIKIKEEQRGILRKIVETPVVVNIQ